MKTLLSIALAAGTLAAAPAFAQSSSPQQMLQGLLTGNQSQDQAVRDAYERGYRAGRQDEARMGQNGRGSPSYNNEGRSSYSRNGNEAPGYNGNGDNGYHADRGYNGNGNYPTGNYNSGRNE